jgi:predicted AlkP superfamily phosphohydrolase/phosphomutase
MVIGLDCAAPSLMFDKYAAHLPNLNGLRARGWWGGLQSCVPPITVPAWMVMFTGREPGELGIYGFRHRVPGTYNGTRTADSASVQAPTLWDRAAAAGKRSCLIGVPPTYPPYPVRGDMVSCFLTPDASSDNTFPRALKAELAGRGLTYVPDVEFRVEEKARLLEALRANTRGHAAVASYLAGSRDWDLFCWVELGLDRAQHAFWRYQDPGHHLYQEGSPFAGALRDYYVLADECVGELLSYCDGDTAVAVVSDHGAKGMKGAFCINQWLAERGWLALEGEAERGTRLEDACVDWPRTRAWAWGGYYARVFLNLEGRELRGTVPPDRYEEELEALAADLRAIRGPGGEEWATRVARPGEVYPRVEGDAPDLMVFLDDLSWRAAGTLGHPGIYLEENDTGPDDAVHDWRGVCILYDPRRDLREEINNDTVYIRDLYSIFAGMLGLE